MPKNLRLGGDILVISDGKQINDALGLLETRGAVNRERTRKEKMRKTDLLVFFLRN